MASDVGARQAEAVVVILKDFERVHNHALVEPAADDALVQIIVRGFVATGFDVWNRRKGHQLDRFLFHLGIGIV